jgi:lipopolysaccharide/colanic/teichoic acid biosynthesis glycosyltransferase
MTTEFGLGRRQLGPARPASSPWRGRRSSSRDVTVRSPARQPGWRVGYSRLAVTSDLAAVAAPAAGYALLGGGAVACCVVIGVAALCLALARAWDPAALGTGTAEFGRLLRGLLVTAGAVGVLSLAFQTLAGRPWVFGVLPVAVALAVAGRVGLRRVVRHRRRHGAAVTRVLAVGSHESVVSVIGRTRGAPELGWTVVAACTPTGAGPQGSSTLHGVPVVGDLDAVPALARSTRFDAVSVSQAPGWSPRRLQQLAWHLEGTDTELLVDPGLLESAGPRTHVATVDGLHLLRLSHPALPTAVRTLKHAVERAAAALLLVLLAPLLLAIAFGVRRDGGPALVREERLGCNGRRFGIYGFRCTTTGDGAVTPVGALLRRHALDRLPQLVNVVAGSMAIVGPRPLPPSADAPGRPLVKPGLTGLWPVGPLGHGEPERLEADYVASWTLALDARLLAASLEAAVRQSPRRRVSR